MECFPSEVEVRDCSSVDRNVPDWKAESIIARRPLVNAYVHHCYCNVTS